MTALGRKNSASWPDNFDLVSFGSGGGLDLAEVIDGLQRMPKSLPPKYFYDARGSELFNAICGTEAYYPTRTECSIYREQAAEIANAVGPDTIVIEFGPGDMSKIRLLLSQLRAKSYVGIDVSESQLAEAGPPVARDHPWLQVLAICGDFGSNAEIAVQIPATGRRVAFFPGSTIGNLEPGDAKSFLSGLHGLVGSSGAAIVGVDFRKSKQILDAAYNDPEGYTRAFNLNLLTRLNRELKANFDERRFRHRAFYDEELGRVEMHLVSVVDQRVHLGEHVVHFLPGESIHTESSYKYEPQIFAELAAEAGFGTHRLFTDANDWFGVFVFTSGEK